MKKQQVRTYIRSECAVFRKTKEEHGGLSNMCAGYPLNVAGIYLKSSEALYQALRYPHRPDIQKLIIAEHSPMTAKMVSKKYYALSRPDWDEVRFKIMKWCIELKLAQNWNKFSEVLAHTGNMSIVEESKKDKDWGAINKPDGTLQGINALGRLLMALRKEYVHTNKRITYLHPPKVSDVILCGIHIPALQIIVEETTSDDMDDHDPLAKSSHNSPTHVEPMFAKSSNQGSLNL